MRVGPSEICTSCGHKHDPATRRALIRRSVLSGVDFDTLQDAWPCFYAEDGIGRETNSGRRLYEDMRAIELERDSQPMTSQSLTLPYPPLNNRYYRRFGKRIVKSSEAKAYKQRVVRAGKSSRVRALDSDVALTMVTYRPTNAGDVDGPIKGCLDSLQGVAYVNDKQIKELHVYRETDKDNPRLEVTIKEVA